MRKSEGVLKAQVRCGECGGNDFRLVMAQEFDRRNYGEVVEADMVYSICKGCGTIVTRLMLHGKTRLSSRVIIKPIQGPKATEEELKYARLEP